MEFEKAEQRLFAAQAAGPAQLRPFQRDETQNGYHRDRLGAGDLFRPVGTTFGRALEGVAVASLRRTPGGGRLGLSGRQRTSRGLLARINGSFGPGMEPHGSRWRLAAFLIGLRKPGIPRWRCAASRTSTAFSWDLLPARWRGTRSDRSRMRRWAPRKCRSRPIRNKRSACRAERLPPFFPPRRAPRDWPHAVSGRV